MNWALSVIQFLRQKIVYFCTRQCSSLTYLNVTQFLGALNDNIFKLLIAYFFIQLEGIENSPRILAMAGAVYVIPFLLFSSWSGTLADRFSKRDIIVLTKILELVVMAAGVVAFAFESKIGSYSVLFLMALQSALFSPSKYGIVPEIVAPDRVSHANGLMTSFTFLAIIIGTFLASFLTQVSGHNFIMAALVCTAISLVGVLTSFGIEYTPSSGSVKRATPWVLLEVYQTLKIAKEYPSLLTAILGSAYFLFIGAFVQLNVIPFAVQSLQLTDVQGGYLFLLMAIGIGTGCLIAGKISGKQVELALVPIGCFGIMIGFFLFDMFSTELLVIMPLIVVLGLFGGIYTVPLDSHIQMASPAQYRGQMIATSNFLSFTGVLAASAFLYVVSAVMGMKASEGFTMMGGLTFLVLLGITFEYFDYLTRFIGMIISKLHFSTLYEGLERIPKDRPAFYVCTHTAWNDTLLLLGAQRRRMRFFIEQEQDHSRFMRRIYRMLRVVLIPSIETLEYNEQCLRAIRKSFQKGISVCIFVEDQDVHGEIEKLKNSAIFREILEGAQYPIIPVTIDKGEKNPKLKLLKKFRVPASIVFG